MITSVKIKFDKFKHDTGKAILISINHQEHWIPKKLCRNLIINKKLGGNVSIPTFIAEKIGVEITDDIATTIHNVPKAINKEVNYDESLFK